MDRLESLRALVVSVDRGSLSAAARALRSSPASVSRAITALEARVGARLVQRTTRALRLTEIGDRYLVVARRVLDDLDQVERSARAAAVAPEGTLTVTAPLGFGALHVRPLVSSYLMAHDDVRARLLLLDRVVNLVDEGVDVAIRIGHLPDSALIAVPVGVVRRLVVASPAYVEKFGRPRSPTDLRAHRCIASLAITPTDTWAFGGGPRATRSQHVRITPVLTTNVADAANRAAIDGVGLTCAISYQLGELVERGTLVRVLQAFEPVPIPVHVVYPASARTAKVRVFVELATRRLRALLAYSAR